MQMKPIQNEEAKKATREKIYEEEKVYKFEKETGK